MKLDYVASTSSYILRVPRGSEDIQVLMQEHGFDFSIPASTATEAVLFTYEPYAAATFFKYGTPAAKANLENLHREIEASWAPESKAHIKVPADQELWPFQKADIEYALRRTNTVVGDEPGLGKTPIAIAYANEIGAKRVLCIVPAALRLQWVKKIREWTTMSWPYYIHPIINGRHGVHPTAQWTVVSYELARSEGIGKALARGTYDLLILDEGHFLKTIDSKRTRAIFGGGSDPLFEPLASRAGSVLTLTGTPLPNRPREGYTLARAHCWDSIDFMSEDRFRERFNPSLRRDIIDEATGRRKIFIDERTGRHAELQNRMRGNFMTRHLKREVMTQLKMPVYDLIQLEETGAIRQALQAERLLDIDPENLEGADAAVLGDIATVRRMMGIAMAPPAADYLDTLLESGEEKLVVFAWHHEVMDILEKKLQKWGVLRWVAGANKANDHRKELFINDPTYHVALGNVLTLGTGTDGLQSVCNHALVVEADWVPGNNIQCFDRLDRGGQTRTVQGDIFVVPGSFAEKILASALRKLQTTHKALDRRL